MLLQESTVEDIFNELQNRAKARGGEVVLITGYPDEDVVFSYCGNTFKVYGLLSIHAKFMQKSILDDDDDEEEKEYGYF